MRHSLAIVKQTNEHLVFVGVQDTIELETQIKYSATDRLQSHLNVTQECYTRLLHRIENGAAD